MPSPSFYDTIKLQILTGRMDMSIVLGFIGIDGIVLATDSKRTLPKL